ncbi:MAG TPA: hypothetical protein VH186_31330 [Chloroflexia bacterium]|nr:hypothetical protein [Chloroflexia bacterium]
MPRRKEEKDQIEATLHNKRKERSSHTQPLKGVVEILKENNTSPTLLDSMVEEGSAQVIVHSQVLLLEFNNSQLLEEVLRGTTLAQYVVRRVSETTLMVDQAKQDELIKVLTKKGYEPKIVALGQV